jgi:uncharacterized protein (UPF0548 family)
VRRRRRLSPGRPTYPEVGWTTRETLPSGYHHTERSTTLGRGSEDFQRCASAVLGWELHRRAGLRVDPGAPRAAVGVDVRIGLGLGPLRLGAPCRVVLVIDEPTRAGFAYGTLPGHPASGEELFCVEQRHDDEVRLVVRAFSRPAVWWSRAAGPLVRRVQSLVTARYLAALAEAPR